MGAAGIGFVKGHGTQNDFVLLPDPDGVLDLTPARVRALCDRRRGLGADGVLRAVRTAAGWDLDGPAPETEWFMDYRNADGSVAEMCGNGMRVFARYLADAELVPGDEPVAVATRAGVRVVRFERDGTLTVEMGAVRAGAGSVAVVGGQEFPGVAVDVGNPHLVCVTDVPLASLDLREPPGYDDTLFPRGVNVEFVGPATPPATGARAVRVHERGVGETRSCGTGTVAAAAVVLDGQDGELVVHVPGGRVRVALAGGRATLTGPAELVAAGELDAAWWHSIG
ncbi:MAG: diaminopimelate epimerase [Pseudonocardia sp.]